MILSANAIGLCGKFIFCDRDLFVFLHAVNEDFIMKSNSLVRVDYIWSNFIVQQLCNTMTHLKVIVVL